MSEIVKNMPNGGEPFDPYFVPDDWARLQYGRLLWKKERTRNRLLSHWTDHRHPYRERFLRYRKWVEILLQSEPSEEESIDRFLRENGQSLRTILREIPPVFGSFY